MKGVNLRVDEECELELEELIVRPLRPIRAPFEEPAAETTNNQV